MMDFITNGVDSSYYEKSSARRKQRLDTYCFCRLRCKSTVGEPAVGLSIGAGAARRRVHHCDTTPMHALRREATGQSTKPPHHGEGRQIRLYGPLSGGGLPPRMSQIYKGGFYPPTLKGEGGPPSPLRGGWVNPPREHPPVGQGGAA